LLVHFETRRALRNNVENHRKHITINKAMQKKQRNELLGEHVYTNLLPIRQANRRAASLGRKPVIQVRTATQHTKRQYTTGRAAGEHTQQP
jgi:hypothetical protein